ncbi:MAG: NAD(+)/NADH kinase [Acidobacteria bacterium]|nr:NAD(+)/NADH kinase [Acidobacteriota bacterium]
MISSSEEPPLGIIVNPKAGSDVRRVLAAASTTTLEEKISIVRRVVLGAIEVGVDRVIINHDPHEIARRATETLNGIDIDIVHRSLHFNEQDTIEVAGIQRREGCGAVVTLGGDGTNRAAVIGWPEMALLPISTGTNNAFPAFVEPTIAGTAAGLVATGVVAAADATDVMVVVRVDSDAATPVGDGLALVDAIVTQDRFVGSLELFDPRSLRMAVLARSDPSAVGFASLGARLDISGPALVRFVDPERAERHVRVATAPGHYATLGVAEAMRLELDEVVEYSGGGVIAYDGERMWRSQPEQCLRFSVCADGPAVIDTEMTMRLAASQGFFESSGSGFRRSEAPP